MDRWLPQIPSRWLRAIAALSMALLAVGVHASEAEFGVEGARTIPIVDAHFHVLMWMDGRELLARMDQHGIRAAGGVGGGNAQAIMLLGDRFIRPTGMGLWLSLHRRLDAAAFEDPESPEWRHALALIESNLRDQGARAIGEIHVNALTSTAEPANRFRTPADSATLKSLLALAGRWHRLLNIHAQWDADTAQEVERLAASNPEARLVLSHCGSTTIANDIRSVFERHANINCDLSARGAPQRPGLRFTIFDESSLANDWRRLIEDYPERFVVGVDTVHTWDEYDRVVRAIRLGLLAHLSPETAEKVAYRNAQVWFGIGD